ncbi:Membrane-associated phosphatidylinositol transfer protein 2 [Liparis tanakae]|uniref:Membrane-associated phosphatidylinositol transfer protein 2 n=1 Tax=Liparis tanakae TaxID=230148 RepID=A0A4Z2HT63_9TELE|nr:Membrane-associated phosphatidylinositol transfer protein 2 [Liparis tanakae]
MESVGAISHRYQDSTVNETSIPVPVLNWQLLTDTDSLHSNMFVDGQVPSPTSPGLPHLRCNRRASEASLTSQVSGLADSYTASNIATSELTSDLPACDPRADGAHADVVVSSLRNVKPASLRGPACCPSWPCPTIGWPLGARPCAHKRQSVGCSPNATAGSLCRARTLA